VRFIHACDIPGVVVRTGVTIIMTFLDSFVRFFVLRLLALLATFVRGLFSLIIMGIFEIFFSGC